jgi:hypothetical protein
MTHSRWTRFVLGLALLVAPALLVGCGETTTTPETPAPSSTPPLPGPTPSTPGDAKPADPGAVPVPGK